MTINRSQVCRNGREYSRSARGEPFQFNLTGSFVYAITMDGGAVFTIDTSTGTGDSLSPDDQIGITAR